MTWMCRLCKASIRLAPGFRRHRQAIGDECVEERLVFRLTSRHSLVEGPTRMSTLRGYARPRECTQAAQGVGPQLRRHPVMPGRPGCPPEIRIPPPPSIASRVVDRQTLCPDTPVLRKARGAFFTPQPIAEYLADWAVEDDPAASVVDPTCGEAVFLEAAGRKLADLGASV